MYCNDIQNKSLYQFCIICDLCEVIRRHYVLLYGPREANLVLIAYASNEGSGEPAHPRSLARTSAARSYKRTFRQKARSLAPLNVMTECSKTQIRLTGPVCCQHSDVWFLSVAYICIPSSVFITAAIFFFTAWVGSRLNLNLKRKCFNKITQIIKCYI